MKSNNYTPPQDLTQAEKAVWEALITDYIQFAKQYGEIRLDLFREYCEKWVKKQELGKALKDKLPLLDTSLEIRRQFNEESILSSRLKVLTKELYLTGIARHEAREKHYNKRTTLFKYPKL